MLRRVSLLLVFVLRDPVPPDAAPPPAPPPPAFPPPPPPLWAPPPPNAPPEFPPPDAWNSPSSSMEPPPQPPLPPPGWYWASVANGGTSARISPRSRDCVRNHVALARSRSFLSRGVNHALRPGSRPRRGFEPEVSLRGPLVEPTLPRVTTRPASKRTLIRVDRFVACNMNDSLRSHANQNRGSGQV